MGVWVRVCGVWVYVCDGNEMRIKLFHATHQEGNWPLTAALVTGGNLDIVRALITHGASVNVKNKVRSRLDPV